VDTPARQISQRPVHHPLPLKPGHAGKCCTLNHYCKMRFARSVVTAMPQMPGAIVDDLQHERGKSGYQPGGNFGRDRASGRACHHPYIARFGNSGSHVADEDEKKAKPAPRFHGRVAGTGRQCMEPGCDLPGEFRAPPLEGAAPRDEPAPYRWFCLDHVRAFNARYNFFSGMNADEISAAQRPYAGWERETRAFSATGADRPPSWADFNDPLDAISARFRARAPAARQDGHPLSDADRRALKILGLATDADRRALRTRYAELVRKFHPDRNGGDRSFEKKLQEVIAAYQLLKVSAAFA
jgi:hypothetical protein